MVLETFCPSRSAATMARMAIFSPSPIQASSVASPMKSPYPKETYSRISSSRARASSAWSWLSIALSYVGVVADERIPRLAERASLPPRSGELHNVSVVGDDSCHEIIPMVPPPALADANALPCLVVVIGGHGCSHRIRGPSPARGGEIGRA